LSDVVTTYDAYDAFNNLTQSTTQWSGGEKRTYVGEYLNEPADTDPNLYILGMQTRSTLTSTPASGATPTTRVNTYEYDPATGLLAKMHVQPDASPNPQERVDVVYTRNAFGQVTLVTSSATDPLDATSMTRTQSFGYDDGDGVFPSSVTNAMGHTTYMVYHPGLGVLAFEMDPNGVKTTMQYDGFGRARSSVADGRGPFTVSYQKVALDTVPAPLSTVIHTEQAGGGSQTTYYNELGRPYVTHARTSDPKDSSVETRYTNVLAGQVASVTRPFFVETAAPPTRQFIEYTYDTLGRVKTEKLPKGNPTVHTYTGLSHTIVDPKHNTSSTLVDDLGRISSTSEILETTPDLSSVHVVDTQYTYGAFDTVTQIDINKRLTDPITPQVTPLRTTTMTYDDLGRRLHLDDPDAGPSDRTYNAFGEVASEKIGSFSSFETKTYVRDQIGRVTQEISSVDGTNTYQWDTQQFGIGLRAGSNSFDGVSRGYFYDSAGRVSEETWTVPNTSSAPPPTQPATSSFAVDYTYDTFGRLNAIRYPTVFGRANRFAVSYHYDQTGVADAVCNAETLPNVPPLDCDPTARTPIWQATERQSDGQLLTEHFANGEITKRQYVDARGLLTNIDTTLTDPTLRTTKKIQSASYGYDQNGNLQTRSDNLVLGAVESFSYDALNRLATVSHVTDATTFTYDDLGNLQSRVLTNAGGVSSRQDYSYVAGPLTHQDMVVNGVPYAFDTRGRNTRVGSPYYPQREIDYTGFDLPKRISVGDGSQVFTFKYDADHKRASKTFTSTQTTYVGDLYEQHSRDQDGFTRDIFYVHGPERTVAQLEVKEFGGGETFSYLHDDHLGSVSKVTDQNLQVTSFDYDVFGARSAKSNDVHMGYTYQEQDDDITQHFPDDPGLVNMKGRMYDPKIGRFLSADPLVASPFFSQGHNRYAYVFNNPLVLIDPSGLQEQGPNWAQAAWNAITSFFSGSSSSSSSTSAPTSPVGPPVGAAEGPPTAPGDQGKAIAMAQANAQAQEAGRQSSVGPGGASAPVSGSDGPRYTPMGGGGPAGPQGGAGGAGPASPNDVNPFRQTGQLAADIPGGESMEITSMKATGAMLVIATGAGTGSIAGIAVGRAGGAIGMRALTGALSGAISAFVSAKSPNAAGRGAVIGGVVSAVNPYAAVTNAAIRGGLNTYAANIINQALSGAGADGTIKLSAGAASTAFLGRLTFGFAASGPGEEVSGAVADVARSVAGGVTGGLVGGSVTASGAGAAGVVIIIP
jgi:RHS repeat-associated protein